MDENGRFTGTRYREDPKVRARRRTDETSGIEIAERAADDDGETGGIFDREGKLLLQYPAFQRITAVANKGTVFKLSLLDKMTDSQGNLLRDSHRKYVCHRRRASTWNAVHTGMRRVISDGSARKIFSDLEVDIAGKTGTAEEIKMDTASTTRLFCFLCSMPESGDRGDGEYPIRIFFLQRGGGGKKYLSLLLRIYRSELHFK